jgi:hypothetical protein
MLQVLKKVFDRSHKHPRRRLGLGLEPLDARVVLSAGGLSSVAIIGPMPWDTAATIAASNDGTRQDFEQAVRKDLLAEQAELRQASDFGPVQLRESVIFASPSTSGFQPLATIERSELPAGSSARLQWVDFGGIAFSHSQTEFFGIRQGWTAMIIGVSLPMRDGGANDIGGSRAFIGQSPREMSASREVSPMLRTFAERAGEREASSLPSAMAQAASDPHALAASHENGLLAFSAGLGVVTGTTSSSNSGLPTTGTGSAARLFAAQLNTRWYDSASQPAGSLALSGRLAGATGTEGGLIEIGPQRKPSAPAFDAELSRTVEAEEESTSPDLGQVLSAELTTDQADPSVAVPSANAAVNRAALLAILSSEGGMIEFSADAGPESVLAAAGGDEPLPTIERQIRMDAGVALFQDFELATAPTLPEAVLASPVNSDDQAQDDARTSQELIVQSVDSAALPALLMLVSLESALDMRSSEKRRDEKRHLLKPSSV